MLTVEENIDKFLDEVYQRLEILNPHSFIDKKQSKFIKQLFFLRLIICSLHRAGPTPNHRAH